MVLSVTLLAWAYCWRRLRWGAARFSATLCMAGLVFYAGIGASYEPVSWTYTAMYCVFTAVFAMSFTWAMRFAAAAVERRRKACEHLDRLACDRVFRRVAIGLYLLTGLVPLLYPEIRISLLWNPPAPDLFATFNNGLAAQVPLSTRILSYASALIWPFYLLALYALRRRYVALLILTGLPAYFRYCSAGYLGRYEMLVAVCLIGGTVWLDRPTLRLRLAVVALAACPLVLAAFEGYSRVRQGGRFDSDTPLVERIQATLWAETSFPVLWERMATSGRRADLGEYATWLVTLPLPKVLTGEFSRSRLNLEITETVSSVSLGSQGYSVVLTGPVIESVFLYGESLFWLHAAMFGIIAGLLCGFAGSSRSLLLVLVSITLTCGFVFMRAGISGSFPTLVNSYLSLYCWAAVLAAGSATPRRAGAAWPMPQRV